MTAPPTKILIVDDEPNVCRLVEGILSRSRFHCTSVYSGKDAKQHLLDGEYDVAILDLFLPDVSGMDLLDFISSQGLRTQAICITGVPSSQFSQSVLARGACDFLEKPFDISRLTKSVRRAAAMRAGTAVTYTPKVLQGDRSTAEGPAGAERDSQREVSRSETSADGQQVEEFLSRRGSDDDERLKQILLESAGALVRAVEAKDPYTRRHSDHVAFYSEHIARHTGVAEGMIESIRVAALLHDIGKIAVPDSVLIKPGKLSRSEFALIQQHPEVGAAILENITLLRAEARLVRHHHENWDGSGYPAGLRGSEIPPGSRILNVADSIDAMLMHRTYKPPYSVGQMLAELDRCAGSQFDPALVQQACQWCRNNPSELILPATARQAETA